jgi:hypothetical protein
LQDLNALNRIDRRQVQTLLDDSEVRPSAIAALGAMGAKDLLPQFRQYVKSSTSVGQSADKCGAIEALSDLKAPEAASLLLDALKQTSFVGCEAGSALRAIARNKIGPSPKELADLAVHGSENALLALGYLGDTSQIPLLMTHFRDRDPKVHNGDLIVRVGDLLRMVRSPAQIPALRQLLDDNYASVRAEAVKALGGTGDSRVVPVVAPFLNDRDDYVQGAACRALGDLKAVEYVQRIAAKLSSAMATRSIATSSVAAGCIEALGALGASQYASIVTRHTGSFVPFYVVIDALEKMKAVDQEDAVVAALAPAYMSNPPDGATSLRQLTPAEILHLLSYIYDDTSRSDNLRALSYFGSGADPDSLVLIQWLGAPPSYPSNNLDRTNALHTIEAFRRSWSAAVKYPRLFDDLQEQTAAIVKTIGLGWRPDDIPELQRTADLFRSIKNKRGGSTRADAITAAINGVRTKQWTLRITALLAIHASFWVAFLFLYAKSAAVRAIFFWNPRVRKIGGLAYVGALLTWTPSLRRRLFQPFRSTLIEDAATSLDGELSYFPESEVRLEDGHYRRLDSVLALKKGRIILEGESGLGKTMFLRHLISSSNRVIVFLPAAKCGGGVVEAIEEKLAGLPKDTDFLRTLIYTGTLDVVIDGLNEVSPNTVANVRSFLSSNEGANIIVTTQPIDWQIPSGVTKYVLQPLSMTKVKEFLHSRKGLLPAAAPVRDKAYTDACTKFVEKVLADGKDPATLAASRVLSNPMDLSVVASMLSQGSEPDLPALQRQQYELVAKDYQTVNANREFPLRVFSAKVFEMRLNDRQELPSDVMMAEIPLLEKHKMVFRRVLKDDKGADVVQWYFRHDKIQDFFLLQDFLFNPDKQEQCVDDARFRGVYFLLATRLPINDANALRELLINRAVDNHDHSVSDEFIKRLRERQSSFTDTFRADTLS